MKATRGARWALRYLFPTLGVCGALGACSSDEGSVATCDRATYVACVCDGARPGVRLCDPEKGYGRCECGTFNAPPGGPSGSGGTGGGGTGGSGGTGGFGTAGFGTAGVGTGGTGGGPPSFPLPPAGVLLTESTTTLIDVFVTEASVLAVWADGVERLGRDGALLGKWAAPREVTAAAFDGEQLVVADRALFTTLGPDLATLGGGELAESCGAAVAITGGRFVCGPDKDTFRVLVTYDMLTGAQIEASDPYTYNGVPMRRVPGTDDFVTVPLGTSPADFHLYNVDASGKPVYLGESPYHGDFLVSPTYAFDGSPPEHLVTAAGLLLEIRPAGCEPGPTVGCNFVKDGNLGTLAGEQRFVAMTNDEAGVLSGLVDLSTDPFDFDKNCTSGCLAQRVDVPTRAVLSQKQYTLGIARVVAAVHDAASSSLVLGYGYLGKSGSSSPFDPPGGYRVELLAYQ